MSQCLLFADPKPLVERLGVDFFRQLPRAPGVYLMRDAAEKVLYIGKARDLRQRLNSYRVANPDRLRRRHLRLLRAVTRIEWRLCADEAAALAHEAELLRTLRPQFNRAGVWPVAPRAILWQADSGALRLKLGPETTIETSDPGWHSLGPMRGARWFRPVLARLLWYATHIEGGLHGLPAGWHRGKMDAEIVIPCPAQVDVLAPLLHGANQSGLQRIADWLRQRTASVSTPFETAWLQNELEALEAFTLIFEVRDIAKHCPVASQ